MTREELEHIIRASGDITDQYEFVIVGSQSILGAVPRPEEVFTVSMEADIYPLQAPELADRIDGAIGEGSRFLKPTATTRKASGPRRPACQPTGCSGCIASRTAIPRIALGTVWTFSTYSLPRLRRRERRIGSSASRCCNTGT